MGGGERGLLRLRECVRGRAGAQTRSSVDVRKGQACDSRGAFKCKKEREQMQKKRRKENDTHTLTHTSCDATNHTRVTRGAGSRSGLQRVQRDSWLLYSPHTPPTHLFYYPSACSAAHTPTQT